MTQFCENLLPRLVGTAAEVHFEPAGPITRSESGVIGFLSTNPVGGSPDSEIPVGVSVG
jgi:hypothetical protein